MSFFLCKTQKMRASLAREMLGEFRGEMRYFERENANAKRKFKSENENRFEI